MYPLVSIQWYFNFRLWYRTFLMKHEDANYKGTYKFSSSIQEELVNIFFIQFENNKIYWFNLFILHQQYNLVPLVIEGNKFRGLTIPDFSWCFNSMLLNVIYTVTHLKNFWNFDWFVEIEFRVSAQTLENKCHVTSIETTVYLIITFNKSINTNNLISDPWSSKALSHKQRTFGHEILKFICLWRYNNTCIICTCIQIWSLSCVKNPALYICMFRFVKTINTFVKWSFYFFNFTFPILQTHVCKSRLYFKISTVYVCTF